MYKIIKKLIIFMAVVLILGNIPGIDASAKANKFTHSYGVFLSVNNGKKDMKKFKDYKTIILDVQNGFTYKDIKKLKKQGHKVYSYINVGAIENYRDYYNRFSDIMLDTYENWPDEKWVDVSSSKWQEFIVNELGKKISDTGVDGFFVDNTDVYYKYQSEEKYLGLTTILKGLKSRGKVIINGGDTYVTEYYNRNGNLNEVLDAVNQESVFSRIIDYDNDKFGENRKSERKFFQKYLKLVKSAGKKCYLLEYTKDKKLAEKIRKYCKKKKYNYYISGKLDLS
ncbi:endo alpha-1,4 polygalactosaminidase [Butyrivibrio sp. NC2002]|uniref:endo alpha-1,4 polygalactosaminidase n=1 Tax=Butyrivibrio sp. NC2002 TaxID=1410610 RepID=UPI00055D401B|nr:endo alpha-1,4 polygalactosaminidase [Butyrivibrio sp. NC2002]